MDFFEFKYGWKLICEIWHKNRHCLERGCGRETLSIWAAETCHVNESRTFYRKILMVAVKLGWAKKKQSETGHSIFILNVRDKDIENFSVIVSTDVNTGKKMLYRLTREQSKHYQRTSQIKVPYPEWTNKVEKALMGGGDGGSLWLEANWMDNKEELSDDWMNSDNLRDLVEF